MKNFKVSVIMSVFNAEKYVGEAIESILNQTYKNFEFIICDDGSTDNSLSIIKKYLKRDKRIFLIKKNKNNGFAGYIKNLNNCLKIAKGKYVARMDADDISLPNRLEKQVDFLEKNKDIFLVGSSAIHINEKGEEIGRFNSVTGEKLEKKLFLVNPFYHSSILFKNENVFKYRPKILNAEDYDAYLVLNSVGKKMTNLSEYLIKYRILSSSFSHSNKMKQLLFTKQVQEFYQQRLNKGFDEYDSFDPNIFLNLDLINKKSEKKLIIFAIKNSLKYYSDLRFYSKKLIKYYGFFNLILIFYLITFIGEKNFNIVIKFIQKIKILLKNKFHFKKIIIFSKQYFLSFFYNLTFFLFRFIDLSYTKKVSKSKIDIIVVAFNNLEILKIQYFFMKKYLLNEFVLHVVDNSVDLVCSYKIKEWCDGEKILYYKFKFNKSNKKINPSESHAAAINYAFSKINFGGAYILLLDHDIIPIKKLDLIKKMSEKTLFYGHKQVRKNRWYYWPGFFMVKNFEFIIKNLDFSPWLGLDTGGKNIYIYNNISIEKCLFVNNFYYCSFKETISLLKKDFYKFVKCDKSLNKADVFEYMDGWIHFGNLSNWDLTFDNSHNVIELINILKKRD